MERSVIRLRIPDEIWDRDLKLWNLFRGKNYVMEWVDSQINK